LGDKIFLKIDRDIEELVPGYLKNRRMDIDKISNAVDQGDFDTARMLGHAMKGNGKSYGFEEISRIGLAIENSGIQKEPEIIRIELEKLLDYLNSIHITYE
jgi:HPt (histidine-containing phosphotransfer) domain-containing protein